MVPSDRKKRLLSKIRQKRCKNVRFEDMRKLVEMYGCVLDRIKGSHHIYIHPGLRRPIVLQKPHGSDFPPPFCSEILKHIEEIIEFEDEE